ncbi:serine protease inhibitor 77Ba-like [Drosophila mauritiana]|uniref:Serine protease inhibitor 77Ba-like n=1 Tax=Drosophila mauritiana TaxID=7226 RepID=A0A6P8K790_DROMA|nr:serine protease inhibitor 77Ba-like [Drosophila mauritiana]
MKLGFLGLFGMVLSLRAYQCIIREHRKSPFLRTMEGRTQFGIKMLQIESTHIKQENFAMTPFSTWSLMLLFFEAADVGKYAYNELRDVLDLSWEYPKLRMWYEDARVYHHFDSENTKLFSLRYAYYDDDKDITFVEDFNSTVLGGEGNVVLKEGQPRAVKFTEGASEIINADIAKASHGKILGSYSRSTFNRTDTILGLTVSYFKAKWKYPFDKSQTKVEQFYDSSGKPAGKVNMMVQTGKFAYTRSIRHLDADFLMLPFGEHELVMIVILPKPSHSVSQVLNQFKSYGLVSIFTMLGASKNETDVEVKLPKFDTLSVLPLVGPLNEAGLTELNYEFADLERMVIADGFRGTYLSHYDQFARIVVDEEGLPDAVPQKSSGTDNKFKFHMNRPFAYFVLEKNYKLLLHSGVFQKGEVQ